MEDPSPEESSTGEASQQAQQDTQQDALPSDLEAQSAQRAAMALLQEAMQESPVATLKKGFAKLQAGEYDEAAVKAKLEAQISDTPAIMYSFTT